MKRELPLSGLVRTSDSKLIGPNDEDLYDTVIVVKENVSEVNFYKLSNTVEKLNWLEEWSIRDGYPLYSYIREIENESYITAMVLMTEKYYYVKFDGYVDVVKIEKKLDEDDIQYIRPLLTSTEIKALVDYIDSYKNNQIIGELIVYGTEQIVENSN
jgi:hypothetical protein